MTKNAKTVLIAAIFAAVVVLLAWLGADLFKGRRRCFDCGDGQRCAIDVRQFATQYSAYSVQLEATLNDKVKVSAKLDPVQLQQLSEAMQSANEFRKYVVSGFNSCAISKTQYGQIGAEFQALDNVAREINDLTDKPELPPDESARLANLIDEYRGLAHKLGTH